MNMMRKSICGRSGKCPREEGKLKGKIELLRMQIQKKLVKGKSISEISGGT